MRTMIRAIATSILIGALVVMTAGVCIAQDGPPEMRTVQEAFENGRSDTLLQHASDRIEIALFGATRRYSRVQARYVLQEFVREYRPVGVTVLEGSGTESGWFVSMDYAYERGTKPLRVYARLRRDGQVWKLNELIVREES